MPVGAFLEGLKEEEAPPLAPLAGPTVVREGHRERPHPQIPVDPLQIVSVDTSSAGADRRAEGDAQGRGQTKDRTGPSQSLTETMGTTERHRK